MKWTWIGDGRKSNEFRPRTIRRIKKASNEFIVEFENKYELKMPSDLYFDGSAL